MNPWKVVAAALVLSAVGFPALAQTPQIQKELGEKLASERQFRAQEAQSKGQRELYEDIEILSRLLDRGSGQRAHLGAHGIAFSPDGNRIAWEEAEGGVRVWDVNTGNAITDHATFNPHGVQGYYLKGQGIVCTTSVPLHFPRKIVGGSDTPPLKTLSEWERVRKELRGEKIEANKPKEADEPSIADLILKVLADNGKNLTHLGDGESVTVAVTLGPVQACTKCHTDRFGGGRPGMMGGGMPGGMMPPGGGRPGMGRGGMMPGGPGGMPPGGGTGSAPGGAVPPGGSGFPGGGSPGPGGGVGGPPSGGGGSSGGPPAGGSGIGGVPGPDNAGDRAEFRKQALLGDLALKQQDYGQAADAYRKAISASRAIRHDAATELELVEVASKCARALIAQGKTEEAENMVKGIVRITDRMGGGAGRTDKPATGKPEMALPDKLIITVPKKLLDGYGAGSIRFDEFRKGASVEHLTFDKPSAEQPKGGLGKP